MQRVCRGECTSRWGDEGYSLLLRIYDLMVFNGGVMDPTPSDQAGGLQSQR